MKPVHRQLDRRSPLVLDTSELARRPGAMIEVHETVPAPADLNLEVIGVPQDSDVDLDLRLEAVVEGVLLTGTAHVIVHGECVRCLTDIDDDATFDLQELYFYPGHEVEEDESLVVDDLIDLQEALRDAVVLNLPFAPLCREDCLGLCPECGARLEDDPQHNHGPTVDPRWEKLAGLDVQDN